MRLIDQETTAIGKIVCYSQFSREGGIHTLPQGSHGQGPRLVRRLAGGGGGVGECRWGLWARDFIVVSSRGMSEVGQVGLGLASMNTF